MTLNKRILTAIATGAVLVNALAPMAFASTITVSGNGENSTSNVGVSTNSTVQVQQSNNANISNNVNSNSSTGGNSSNGNTGGSTSITTGNATANTTVTNAANLNKADLSNCGCSNSGTNVTVKGNGEDSNNTVGVTNANSVYVNQTNDANFSNHVDSKAQTGGNDATSNTGGNTSINTGDANATVTVSNAANANVASVGNGVNGAAGGSSVTIKGNGENSSNVVGLEQGSAIVLAQSNDANFKNNVDADAKSGHNTANGNTDGNVSVTTGDAKTKDTVDNAANFNAADLNCGCVLDGLNVDIDKNGEDSWNAVEADANNVVAPEQANDQGFWNNVDGNSKTGDNTAVSNTDGSTTVTTNAGTSKTDVNNAGNVNTIGNVGGISVGTTFDFSSFWSFLNGIV